MMHWTWFGWSIWEWIGFVSGVWGVYLLVKEHIWNWPVGLINSASWLILFWYYRIYLNSGLQILYLVLGIYGWWYWYARGQQGKDSVRIRLATRNEWLLAVSFIIPVTALLTWLMVIANDVAPFWDAVTTVVSIVALVMQAKKIYQNWFLWISVDVVYLFLYGSQHLYLTAITQVAFGALCVMGLRQWAATRKSYNELHFNFPR